MNQPPVIEGIAAPARGEPVTAAFLRSLVARIERLERGGGGLDPVSAVFAAMPSGEFVQCRVAGRRFDGDLIPHNIDDALPEPKEVPSRFTYDVRAVRRKLFLTGLTPVYGREVRYDESLVYPARVGQVCYLVRSPGGGGGLQGELMLLPGCEVPARRRCGTAVGAPGGGGGPVIPPPPPPPEEGVGKGGGDSVAGGLGQGSLGGGLAGGGGVGGGFGGGVGGGVGGEELLPSS